MFRHLAIAVIVAFTASAVFGLCAMAMTMAADHEHMACTQSSVSMLACEGNVVRHAITTGSIVAVALLLVLIAFSIYAMVVPDVIAPPPYQYVAPAILPAFALQEAFSRGILQPKLFS